MLQKLTFSPVLLLFFKFIFHFFFILILCPLPHRMWDPILQQGLNRLLLQWNCYVLTTGKVGKSRSPIFLNLSIWYFAIWAYVSCFHNFHIPMCANFLFKKSVLNSCCSVTKSCPALCDRHGYIYIYIYFPQLNQQYPLRSPSLIMGCPFPISPRNSLSEPM